MQAKCRLCLKKVGARKGLSINDSNFSTLLSRVFIFPVSQIEPNLPQGVCSRCVSTVRNFHDYSQEVQQNQTFLLQGLITKRKGSEEDHTKWEAAVTVKHEFPPDADDKTESFPELNDDEGEEDASDIIMPIEDVELTENEQEDFLSDDERSRNFDTLAPDDGNAIGRSRKSELHENDRIIQEFFKMRCELCPEQDEHSFDRFYTLQLHYRRQHQTRGYVRCCGVQLYRRFRVMEHIESHRGTIRCEICEKLFKSYSYLRRHMAERHLDGGIDRASYTCEHCKRKFSTAGQLTVHRQSHVTTVCKLCGKTVSMRYLKKHVALIHEAVRNWYMCDLCGKNFSSSMVLDRHIKHHQGIETVEKVDCPHCGKQLNGKYNLQKHVRTMHEERGKVYRCDVCGHVSPNSVALQSHKTRVHTGKHYACDQCGKHFKQKIYLREHVAALHTRKPLYACEFCDAVFNSSANYYTHRKARHREKWEALREAREEQEGGKRGGVKDEEGGDTMLEERD